MRREDSQWWSAGFTADWWKQLPRRDREVFLATLSEEEATDFFYDWRVWARDKQIPDDWAWRTWLIVAGRGFGKTRTAVEFINEEIRLGNSRRIAIVGQGESDIRKVMIEGQSGFLKTARPGERPTWSPSVNGGTLEWPCGAVAFVHSAEDYESLRGPEYDTAWFDEPMAVNAKKREETVSNLRFGLRIVTNGCQPRLIYTTTPKRHKWMKELLKDAENPKKKILLTRGSTYENADNLAEAFIEGILEDYEGTRLGKQEIHGELLTDEDGALWTEELLEQCRDLDTDMQKIMAGRIVVAVDPNLSTDQKTAHAAGIIAISAVGKMRYVIADRSCKGGPMAWSRAAVLLAKELGTREIVAEANQGGEMVRITIQMAADELDYDVSVHLVHASKGKVRRAEPAATAYERGRVRHCGLAGKDGPFAKLEDQMTSIHDGTDPTKEDFDRVDALVWGLHRLGLKKGMARSRGRSVMLMTGADFGVNTNAEAAES